ncbi:thioredoxin TrxC [Pseudoalteromonas xiamenensis]|uniref:thioredoxin TrxC n=1 Tax=Pseudoalteromonas xiamenensis TaxID=882626 RepID=UPI0027E43E6F|nr:thioredoxin TrxC [Pseudoalteromonas xiamenensis]WMN59666.1 thioredoxin TrxC [Pseudoalteromonas xiamenensis]
MNSSTQLVCSYCGGINRVPSTKIDANPLCGKCKEKLLVGKPIALFDSNFQRSIEKTDLPVVVDFWATWCGPCQNFAPIFEEVAQHWGSRAVFAKLDTDANQQVSSTYQIRSIPTLMVFKQGKEVARISGALPRVQFEQWLSQVL